MNYGRSLLHAVASFAAFGIPLILMGLGANVTSLTIGAVLTGLYHAAMSYLDA